MLFSIVKHPEISAIELNRDLDVILMWAHQWKLEFNPDPTKQANEILFSCKKSSPNHPQIIFNGTVVAKMNDQKHLDLSHESSLSFKKHINEKIIKAKKNLGINKHLSMFLPRKTLDQMYKVPVRSHLDYCDIIYHIPSVHTQFGVTLTDLMEKLKEFSTTQLLLLPVHVSFLRCSKSNLCKHCNTNVTKMRVCVCLCACVRVCVCACKPCALLF